MTSCSTSSARPTRSTSTWELRTISWKTRSPHWNIPSKLQRPKRSSDTLQQALVVSHRVWNASRRSHSEKMVSSKLKRTKTRAWRPTCICSWTSKRSSCVIKSRSFWPRWGGCSELWIKRKPMWVSRNGILKPPRTTYKTSWSRCKISTSRPLAKSLTVNSQWRTKLRPSQPGLHQLLISRLQQA